MNSPLRHRVAAPPRPVAVPTRTPVRHGRDWRPLLATCLLALLTVLPYANSMRNGFVWDDHQQIVMNPDLQPGSDWSHLFSAGVWSYLHRESPAKNLYYRPLQMATYRAVIATAGVSPLALHAVCAGFATASVLLAFAFFWKITGRMEVAYCAAALFAVHPIHAEAVDWISALPDIGCTVFVLLAFLFFLLLPGALAAANRNSARSALSWLVWTLSVGCFAAALLWKETAAVFPVLVAVHVFLVPHQRNIVVRLKAAMMASLPFWMVVAGYLLLRFRLLGVIAASQRNWELSPLSLALTVVTLMADYWWKLLLPVHLSAYHVFSPQTSLLDVRAAAAVAFVVLMLRIVVYAARRMPLVSFCIAWVFITLLPVMDIYAVGRNVFAERYLYLPSVGFCLLITLAAGEVLQKVPVRRRTIVGFSALAAVVVTLGSMTSERNSDWQDDATLFASTLETSPNAPFVHIMVAAAENDKPSGHESAEQHYLEAANLAAAEVPPDRVNLATAYRGLASIYSERSDYERSLAMLGKAREADPSDTEIDGEQGLILTRAGRWEEASQYLQRAAGSSGENENVLNALGIYAQRSGHELDQAASYFKRALAVHPAQDNFNASLRNNLGSVYGEQGRYADAIVQFKAAEAIAPGDPEYGTNLATALAASGRYEEARQALRPVLTVTPNYEPARALWGQLGSR